MIQIKKTLFDRAIEKVAPTYAQKRYQSRAQIAAFEQNNGFSQPGQKNKKFLRSSNVSSNSPDFDTIDKQEGSIAISRDAWMNNTLAVAMLRRIKTTTIGTGLKLQSQIDADFLNLQKEEARAWQKNVERRFNNWAQSKDCDITRQQNFFELQDLAFFSVLLSGDCFALFPYKKIKSLSSGIRIRLIEADLCSTPFMASTLSNKKNVAGGIEFDSDGAPTKYYFSKHYPGQNTNVLSMNDWVGVNAFSKSGKKQIHHLFTKDRPGQRRGMPLVANLINDLMKVTKLQDAELTAHVVSSLFTVFVKDMSGVAEMIDEGYAGDPNATNNQKANVDEGDSTKVGMDTGNIVYLDDKKEIQIAETRKTSESFNQFYESYVKLIASAVEIPFEQMLLHFQASYSASRGALLEAWKATRVRRAWCSINFCQPAFVAWLDEQVASRKIIAPGYFEDIEIKAAWCKTSWSGMGNGQLDPMKETKAAVMSINNNLSSHEKEYNKIHDDGDWEGNVLRRSDEEDLIKEKDLMPVAKVNALTMVDDEETEEEDT